MTLDRLGIQRNMLYGVFVACVAFIVYANSLTNGFAWDDSVVIEKKQALRGDILSLFTIRDAALDTELNPFYRPLTYATFFVEWRIHGLNPSMMHLLNVLLHAANAFLVFLVAYSVIGSPLAASLVGLLFAVHPVNAESVNFLSGGRNTLLSTFFVLVAFLLHQSVVRKNRIPGAVAGAAAFFAGLLSKEFAISVLPFIIFLEARGVSAKTSDMRRSVFRLVPYIAVSVIYFVLRSNALSGSVVSLDTTSEHCLRLLNNIYVIPRYMLNVVWPVAISLQYDLPDDMHLFALPLFAAWSVIGGCLVWLLSRPDRRVSIFGIAWAMAFWLPVSGIIFFPGAPLADRYFYAPGIGIWLVIADQTSKSISPSPGRLRLCAATAAIVILLLSGRTIVRNFDWKDSIALFSSYVHQNPERPFGHHALGAYYLEAGEDDSAEREFRYTLELAPSNIIAYELYNPLGTIRLKKGDYEGALSYLTKALEVRPGDQDARIKRAFVFKKLGRQKDALMDYQVYLSLPQGSAESKSREYVDELVSGLSR